MTKLTIKIKKKETTIKGKNITLEDLFRADRLISKLIDDFIREQFEEGLSKKDN